MPSQAEMIRTFVESMPSTRHLGIRIVELAPGRTRFEMDKTDAVTFDGTTVQGGIVAVLADYAAVAACGASLAEGWLMATTGSQTHNLAPASGSRLVAIAEVVRPGRRHAVARVDVYNNDESGVLCLTGLFTATGIAPA